MGGIVKSIGKAIKKVGQGIKKVVKKIGPALIVAAAVYTGVALIGAGGFTGIGSLAPSNFGLGLTRISQGFQSVLGIGAEVPPGPTGTGLSSTAATPFSSALGETAGGVSTTLADAGGSVIADAGVPTTLADAGATGMTFPMSTVTSSIADAGVPTGVMSNIPAAVEGAGAASPSSWIQLVKDFVMPNLEDMTTGEALAYMTKMNMLITGFSSSINLFNNKEMDLLELQMAHDIKLQEMREEHEKNLLETRIAHESAMEESGSSYGAPSEGQAPVDWTTYFSGGGYSSGGSSSQAQQSTQMPRQLASNAALPAISNQALGRAQYQSIGQPTIGRQTTRNFETAAPRISGVRSPGIITQAARKGIV